jgi:hypothetical protein
MTDQNRPRDAFIDDHLHGTQHAIVASFSKTMRLGACLACEKTGFMIRPK